MRNKAVVMHYNLATGEVKRSAFVDELAAAAWAAMFMHRSIWFLAEADNG